jgi:hypothetical protein
VPEFIVEVSRDKVPKELNGTFTLNGHRYVILGEDGTQAIVLFIISIKFENRSSIRH